MTIETRSTLGAISKIEARALQAGNVGGRQLEGYAVIWNSPSLLLPSQGGQFREYVKPYAFTGSLASKVEVRALINYDPCMILGRLSNLTLRLEQDGKGLRFSIDLPDTSYARDLAVSIARGDIDGCSFGFRNAKDSWRYDGKTPVRDVISAEIFDVSIVTIPAYPKTEVALRRLKEFTSKPRTLSRQEARLRIADYEVSLDRACRS